MPLNRASESSALLPNIRVPTTERCCRKYGKYDGLGKKKLILLFFKLLSVSEIVWKFQGVRKVSLSWWFLWVMCFNTWSEWDGVCFSFFIFTNLSILLQYFVNNVYFFLTCTSSLMNEIKLFQYTFQEIFLAFNLYSRKFFQNAILLENWCTLFLTKPVIISLKTLGYLIISILKL